MRRVEEERERSTRKSEAGEEREREERQTEIRSEMREKERDRRGQEISAGEQGKK